VKPLCSIVIPVRNKASVTRQCLNTLTAHPPASVDLEITVVDDGSTDVTPRLLASYGDRIGVLRHAASEGFATACNHGALMAAGEYLVFLNNDTIPMPGWLDALVDCAKRHGAGIVGSKLLFPDDTVQHAGVAFGSNGMPFHLYYRFPADHPAVNKCRRFQAVTGACLLVRRDLFEVLGGFDTAFFNMYEDVDLCLRAGETGQQVWYCPTSVLYHLQSVTRASPTDPLKGNAHSVDTLWARWRDRVHPDEVAFYVDDGLIDVSVGVDYPRTVTVSPLIGVIDTDQSVADRLLVERSRLSGELLSKHIALDLRVQDLETQALSRGDAGEGRMPLTWPEFRATLSFFGLRSAVAGLYLEGTGIEIGALHSPLPVNPTVTVRYVDRMCVADLRKHYPELDSLPLVEPDIIDNGEQLASIADATQDFVIASHFLEHCQDPIGAIKAMLRVVRPGGVVYLAVPDKRYTFDRKRPVTPLEHLTRDHEEGPAWSKERHFEEWATLAEDDNIGGRSAQELMAFDYSIHFHVWTQAEFLELLAAMQTRYLLPFEMETIVCNQIEVIAVLRRRAVDGRQTLGSADCTM
jgi:GT2 family glycosyltransferase/SAM-dependent methyltransferase